MFCAGGMRGTKHIRFPGLTKEGCPLPTLVIEIKGLGLDQDLNPNSNVTWCVIFSQRKEGATTSVTDYEDDASIAVKLRQCTLQKVTIPFVKYLREGDPSHSEVLNNDATCDLMQSVLFLDRDMPFLYLLKIEEVSEQMINNRLNVGKTGTKFTECGSSCDRSRLFDNDKFNQKKETAEQVDTPLRMHTTKVLKLLANKSCQMSQDRGSIHAYAAQQKIM